MRLGNLGEQIMIRSKKAFSRLKFVKSERVPWTTYYIQRQSRDAAARVDFQKETASKSSEGLFMIDILRNRMERTDARLR